MVSTSALPVAVLGSTGYTGMELLRLLLKHPYAALSYVGGRSHVGESLGTVHPQLGPEAGLRIDEIDPDKIAANARAVFCALPHAASMDIVKALRERRLTVFDLSADFRLRDHTTYEQWYGPHTASALLKEAVYGLPELFRHALTQTDLIAVPGCYPTATILALAPLLKAGLIDSSHVIVDAKSGVSGAGRTPTAATHYPDVAEGIRSYKVGGHHRHLPEILQTLNTLSATPVAVTFTPHLVPMTRGMLVTAYAKAITPGLTAQACRQAAREFYVNAPFIRVLPEDQNPDTLWIRGTNHTLLSYTLDPHSGWIIIQSALDNLVKGASGQAIQCMNIRFGWPETASLEATAIFP